MEMLILRTKNGPFGLFWTEMTQKSIIWIGNRTCFAVHTPFWEMEDNPTGRHWIPPRKSGCNAHRKKIDACAGKLFYKWALRSESTAKNLCLDPKWMSTDLYGPCIFARQALISSTARGAGDPAAYIHIPGPQVARITKGRELKRWGTNERRL